MFEILIVGCGGFVGAILRYVVSGFCQSLFKTPFPLGTLIINGTGSLIIGIMTGVSERMIVHPHIRLLVTIGVLGAYTTFSTFSYETMMLIRTGAYLEAFFNIGGSLLLGLVMVFAGFFMGQSVRF